MQRTFTHFNSIVCSDIHSHNRINFMACFFYAGLRKTFRAMGTAGTVRMHMILYVIRIRDDGKMNAVMAFLCTLLLSGGFAKAFVLIYRRLLKSVG